MYYRIYSGSFGRATFKSKSAIRDTMVGTRGVTKIRGNMMTIYKINRDEKLVNQNNIIVVFSNSCGT